MLTNEARHLSLKPLRTFIMLGGGAVILMALSADRIGFGVPGSFGNGQIFLLAAGLVFILLGALGRRIVAFYRGTALVVLNMLLLFACLELASIVIARAYHFVSQTADPRKYAELPYYRAQTWSDEFLREQALYVTQLKRYHPYGLWRGTPFEGAMVSVAQSGLRRTPGADCHAHSYKVLAFGGSTMWGWGSPDWGTIPAYLQSGLVALRSEPVCVVNFGQDAFVSTQSQIELLAQLQFGSVPDLVIFYDGVNEVYAAHETGQPYVHTEFDSIASRFNGEEHPLVEWFKRSRQFWLLTNLVANLKSKILLRNAGEANGRTLGGNTDSLADSVVQNYLGNYRIVSALAEEYEFEYAFFWQPTIAIGEKPLTVEEQIIRSELDSTLVDLQQAIYRKIRLAAFEHQNLYYIADVLDKEDEQIWIDSWGHITPVGNQLVAKAMLGTIEKSSRRIDYGNLKQQEQERVQSSFLSAHRRLEASAAKRSWSKSDNGH